MIKKFLILFLIMLGVGIFICPQKMLAQSASEGLYVSDFSVNITLEDNSWLTVSEDIEVVFETAHHGIYRYIPYRYHDGQGNIKKINYKILSVKDSQGNDWEYQKGNESGKLYLKIGDPNQLITGKYHFNIIYKMWGAINYFDDEAELYWNVTGNDWLVPINSASVNINIDDEDCSNVVGYYGSYGEKNQAKVGDDKKCSVQLPEGVELAAGEGLTMAVRWPKEITPQANLATRIWLWITWNWIYLLPLLVFVLAFWIFLKKGRDPKGRGTIVVQFEPPKKFTSIEVGALYDNKTQGRDFSAMLIDFAVRGYILIKEIKKKGVLGGTEYQFIRKKDSTGLKKFEKSIFDELFSGRDEVKTSDLENKFYVTRKKSEKEIFNGLVSGGYYNSSPLTAGSWFYVSGVAIIFSGFFMGAVLVGWGISFGATLISFILSGIILIILGIFMPRRTKEGVLTYEKIMGFRLYLETAEKYRLEFAEKKQLFEKYLPYAMALGVAEIWAKKFKNIYKEGESPGWYSGYHGAIFTSYAFTRGLNSGFSSSVNSAFTSTPSSSGSSGFGGGGFSGGGGGGGGGGGW